MITTTHPDPSPVALRTRRDFSIAVQALKHRAESLEKLAEKNDKEGYSREARTQRADASAIKDVILPAFREQGELPLVTTEQLRGGIAEALRDIVRGQLIVRAPEEKQEDALQSREERLLDALAIRIEAFAVEIAQSAYAAGYSARLHEPEVIANEALSSLGAIGL